MKTAKFKEGQKVKNQYGEIRTVREVWPFAIFVYEEPTIMYHPTKLTTI